MTNIPMIKTDGTKNGKSEFWLFGDWLFVIWDSVIGISFMDD
jgi:hypothetical protein